MCLAIPAKVISLNEYIATVEIGNVQHEANIMLLPEIKVDDYVLLHAGYAIQRIDEDEAFKTLELLQQMEDFYLESEKKDDVSNPKIS